MKKVAIIQARMGSTRFPGKVLRSLGDQLVIQRVVNAALKASLVDEVVVTTSVKENDNQIYEWCIKNDVRVFRGSEDNVLKRFYGAAKEIGADIIVRLTGDCPFLDPWIIDQIISMVTVGNLDYATNTMPPTWPDGLDCEAFTFKALEQAHLHAKRSSDTEHVTPYIRNNQKLFKTGNFVSPIKRLHEYRFTVDTPADLEFMESVYQICPNVNSFSNLVATISEYPDLASKQPLIKRDEGFDKSKSTEDIICENFSVSQQLLNNALEVIPLGSQTFSKAYIQYPKNTAPLFLTHGQGSRVWDVDGNEYVDLVSALLPNILGYCDPDVNFAINEQLQKGISFSLPTELEIQLAEKLCQIIPSAEKVRFAKNGTDVTSAAIRLVRAYTSRDKIIVCGYHGWQDWYIGSTTRNKGVPSAISGLTTSVKYNDLEVIEKLIKSEEYAAIIMEPCNSQEPLPGYLKGIKDICEKHGSLLIFDEIITGFRFALGGAQEYFGVTPHLSCFGKAMGNGMPISAIVGRNDIMKEMEEIFFSGTFGGEALSLAAAIATIDKIEEAKVIPYLWEVGDELTHEVNTIIKDLNLEEVIALCGFSPWKILQFKDCKNASQFEIRTFFMQEMIKRGVLILGSHNVSFSHNKLDRTQIILAYKEVLNRLQDCLKKDNLKKNIHSPVIESIFKVRT